MTEDLQLISIKIPRADLRRIPGNRSRFVREAIAEKLSREFKDIQKPKTAAARKMLKLRERFIARGGELLDSEGIAEELRQRRGGLS